MLHQILDWLAQHDQEMMVNIVASLPFLLFEILVLVTALPIIQRRLELRRTRVLRSEVMGDVNIACETAMTSILQAGRYLRDEDTQFPPLSKLPALSQQIEMAKGNLANVLPVYISVLDPEYVRVVVNIFRTSGLLFAQLQESCNLAGAIDVNIDNEYELFTSALTDVRRFRDLYARIENPWENEQASFNDQFREIVRDLGKKALAFVEASPIDPEVEKLLGLK